MRIIGIDPGTRKAGIAVVDVEPLGERVVWAGTLRAGNSRVVGERLLAIYQQLGDAFGEFAPDAVAMEGGFVWSARPNVQNTTAMGRGVALLAAAQHGVPVSEYAPAAVKKAATGKGNASKADVQRAVHSRYGAWGGADIEEDAADALAAALAHIRGLTTRG